MKAISLQQLRAEAKRQLLQYRRNNSRVYRSNAIRAEGGTMQVAVKDRGEAIALERQQAIFEPYARNDQSGQRGAGLGLALCRAIAQAHGGSLTVRRRNGGGNSFTFSMPVDPQQPVGDAACP